MHSIKSDRLEAGVLFAIQQQVHLAVVYSELAARINSAPLKKSKSKRREDTIAAKEKELAKIMRYKQALYQDWKDGEITRNDYRHLSEDYERPAEALSLIHISRQRRWRRRIIWRCSIPLSNWTW